MDYVAIGQRIKAARKIKGMSQAKLAEIVGYTPEHISHAESGSKMALEGIVKIANALDTTVDMLLCDVVSHSEPAFKGRMSELLTDCSTLELAIIADVVDSIKKSLRQRLTSHEE